jgi:hypothetical protein
LVRKIPGLTVLTVTPVPDSSRLKLIVRLLMAALLAA